MQIKPTSLKEIASLINSKFIGNENHIITGFNEIHRVVAGDIVFVDHPKYYDKALNSAASTIIINKQVNCPEGKALIIHPEPFTAFNFLTKHRGILHSMTFCLILTVILASFNQKLALPFFLGYSLHLVADSFTIAGIKPFWPSTKVIKGFVRTGGLTERILLCSLITADVILFIASIT